MRYEITNAKAGISFTAEIDFEFEHNGGEIASVLGADLSKACGWDWRPVVERGKFYTATTSAGFDVVVARRKYGSVTALFSDGSIDESLSMDSLTEIEPL